MTAAEREIVLLSDPRVAAIPVEETGDPLVHLASFGGISVAKGMPVPPLEVRRGSLGPVHALVRLGLAVRLARAARSLPPGIGLRVVEGYRPPELQRAYFEAYRLRLLRDDPSLTPDESRVLASRFVAPPAVAAHPSGAAVDLTLIDADGQPLDMGTPIDATPEASRGACCFDAPNIDAEARARRHLLASCLEPEGIVNYPTEWWHWSYGDRYWAFTTGQATAIYGPR
ncbi:MAG: M15 family metallopeptidase [Chloroflexota bacterium]